MHRRTLLAAGAAALAAPSLAQPAAARTLRFVPFAGLSSIDPIWTSAFNVRDHGFLVYDTLYGTDADLVPRPQMAEGHETSADGLTWTIRLREGLRFHDGEPVRARDCVASLARWAKRDGFGQTWAAALEEMRASDDRTMVFRLKRPFPQFLAAIGKPSSNVPFIMPERVALTDAATQITDATGSGPYRFLKDEWQPGARSTYARFDGYAPRQEAPSWSAGGKVANIERIEWLSIPDAATAAAALQSGEINWWGEMQADLVPTIRRSRNARVVIYNKLGTFMSLRFNSLHPPFDNPAVRRAVMLGIKQSDYALAIQGDDPELSQVCPSYWTCGTPLSTDAANAPLRTADIEKAAAALKASGYRGEKALILQATDIYNNKASGEVTFDLLKRMGMNAELVATDWGTVVQKRANKEPNVWGIFHTGWSGLDNINPAVNVSLRTNGAGAWFGWPDDPRIEKLREEWFAATDPEAAKRTTTQMQVLAFETVPYIPLCLTYFPSGVSNRVQGVLEGPVPYFWNVRKT